MKLTKEQLHFFVLYLKCAIKDGKYFNYTGVTDREEMYQYCLCAFTDKCLIKLLSNAQQPNSKKITIPINFAEEKTLFNCVFSRVDCDDYILQVQEFIKLQLRPVINVKPIFPYLR